MNSTTPYGVALRRGLIASVATGLLVFCTVISTTTDWRTVISVTGVATMTPFVARFGWEGRRDTRRAAEDEG